jgi:alpha-L-fucosidase
MKLAFTLSTLLLIGQSLFAEDKMEDGWFTEIRNSPEMQEAVSDWQDLGFEIFIHWSAGTVFQGRYHGKELNRDLWGEWILRRAGIPVSEYEEVLKTWNPTAFNAQEWADIIESSGAKMVVYITKHHDGFAQFKSEANDFNTHDWGAFQTDVFGEVCKELHKRGIKTGFYYSHGKDWRNFPNGGDKGEIMQNYFNNVAYPQLRELNQNYGPQSVCWFDLGAPTRETAKECVKILRETNPYIMISSRVGFGLGDFSTGGDAYVPPVPQKGAWETCMTFTYHWAWYPEDNKTKTPEEVIQLLARIRSRGGNLLLNIGPDVRGKITFREKSCLKKVGDWLRRNGDSIYGVRATAFADLPWGVCTKKPGKLFLHVLKLPSLDYLYVPGIKTPITGAYLLADPKKTPLKVEEDAFGGKKVYLYDADSSLIDYRDTVVVLTYNGELKIDSTPVLDNDLTTSLKPQLAACKKISCTKTRLKPKTDHLGVEEPHYVQYAYGFGAPNSRVGWKFNCVATNLFYLNIIYSNLTDTPLTGVVTIGDKEYDVKLPPTATPSANYLGSFKLACSKAILIQPGTEQTLTFRIKDADQSKALNQKLSDFKAHFMLDSIALKPAYPLPYRGFGGNPDTTLPQKNK